MRVFVQQPCLTIPALGPPHQSPISAALEASRWVVINLQPLSPHPSPRLLAYFAVRVPSGHCAHPRTTTVHPPMLTRLVNCCLGPRPASVTPRRTSNAALTCWLRPYKSSLAATQARAGKSGVTAQQALTCPVRDSLTLIQTRVACSPRKRSTPTKRHSVLRSSRGPPQGVAMSGSPLGRSRRASSSSVSSSRISHSTGSLSLASGSAGRGVLSMSAAAGARGGAGPSQVPGVVGKAQDLGKRLYYRLVWLRGCVCMHGD